MSRLSKPALLTQEQYPSCSVLWGSGKSCDRGQRWTTGRLLCGMLKDLIDSYCSGCFIATKSQEDSWMFTLCSAQISVKSGSEHNKHVDGVVWGGQRSNSKYQQNMDSQTLVPQIDSWTSLWVETVWEESVFGYNEKSWALECLSKSRIRQEKMFPQIRWRLIHGDDCSLSNYTWMDIYT